MPSRVFTEGIGHTNETVSATVDSSGNLVMAKDIKLPAAGGIKTSGGSAIINESSGTVTVTNATLGSSVVVPSSIGGVPSGAIMPFSSITIPTGWLACNGAEYSRSTYASLFSFVSFTDATCDTNSNTSVTMDSTALVGAGFGVSGTGIAAGTTVASVTNGTTLVLSQAATATASNVTLTFMRWGVGTTDANFRVPNFQGAFLRGTGTGTINSRSKAGGLVGVFQEDEFQGHYHEFKATHNVTYGNTHGYITVPQHSVSNTNFDGQTTWPLSGNQSSALVRNPVADLTNGTPRTSTETSPYNASVQYCIKF